MAATKSLKKCELDAKWYLIDATDCTLGRLAAYTANILRGKNKPTFTPHVDTGDAVIIINCDKVVLTGKKAEQKIYYRHSGFAGGLKQVKYGKLLAERSDFLVYHAVKGMLPKTSLGRQMLKKLRVYKGGEHNQQAQQPEVLVLED